jgi:hypothetical protein
LLPYDAAHGAAEDDRSGEDDLRPGTNVALLGLLIRDIEPSFGDVQVELRLVPRLRGDCGRGVVGLWVPGRVRSGPKHDEHVRKEHMPLVTEDPPGQVRELLATSLSRHEWS